MELAVGSTFSSFEKLEAEVKAYQSKKYVQLVKRDTRTLEMARKRVPKRVDGANTALIYYSIHYTCAFGGKSYKSKGTGLRRNQSTLKQGCQAGIKIKLSEDRQSLVVMDISEDHNHVVDKNIYNHLPYQRRLDTDEKENVEGLIKLKVNKKLLQQHISEYTQKVVTLKDISNIKTGLRSRKDKNDISAVVSKLKAMEDLENLKVPPVMRKRGRPKGAEKTVIGLPRCKKFKGEQIRKPVAFLKKTTANREEVMLSWFLDHQVKRIVLERKRLVEEEDVEIRPERISSACLEEDVCIQSIQKYFSKDAWCTLLNVLDVLRNNLVWYCGICAKEINDEIEDSIKCDSCLTWFHFQCVCIKKCPKVKEWFCRHCRASTS